MSHAEASCHAFFQKYGLASPVHLSSIDLGPGKLTAFPFIRFSSWVKLLLQTDRFCRQLGGVRTFPELREMLGEFWTRYRILYPQHQVFSMNIDLTLTVPVYSHTDEGRSFKHQPIWVLSTHGAIGRGTKAYIDSQRNLLPIKQRPLGLNYTGSTWSTHFMSAAILRATMVENEGAMDKIFTEYANDMSTLIHVGVLTPDKKHRVRILHLGNKGCSASIVNHVFFVFLCHMFSFIFFHYVVF